MTKYDRMIKRKAERQLRKADNKKTDDNKDDHFEKNMHLWQKNCINAIAIDLALVSDQFN